MIPHETECGIYIIVSNPDIGMVSICKQGLLVREAVQSFNVGDDGVDIQECYDKAMGEAAQL